MIITRIRRNRKARRPLRLDRPRPLTAYQATSAAVSSWATVAGRGGSVGHGSACRLIY